MDSTDTTSTGTGLRRHHRANPWLVWMGCIAGLPLFVGVLLLLTRDVAVGVGLLATGGVIAPLWLAAGAICWQIQRR
jgi:hypothetical protein